MDGVFLASIAVAAEIEIKKSVTYVWYKDSSSRKWGIDSESRNFLIKKSFRQCLESILIGYNSHLGWSYHLSINWEV